MASTLAWQQASDHAALEAARRVEDDMTSAGGPSAVDVQTLVGFTLARASEDLREVDGFVSHPPTTEVALPGGLLSGELFAGAGGLGMAVDAVFGTRPAYVCEFDEAPSKVLAHRLPGVPNYGDVTKVDFTTVPHTHVRSGGFPCQDVSLAGRRLGLSAGKRSGLWSEFARSIEEDRPDWVVIENVRGLLSAEGEPWHDDLIEAHDDMKRLAHLVATAEAFAAGNPARRKEGRSAHARRWKHAAVRIARQHKRAVARFNAERRLVQRAIAIVLRDLADLGFDAEWTGIRASDVGAPHGRYRVFILAWPSERTVAHTSDRTGDGEWPRPEPRERSADPVLTLLPTPIVSDGTGGPKRLEGAQFAPQMREITQLLPTPDAYSGSRGGSQPPEKRRDGGHTVSLADVTEHALMPTPRASDHRGGVYPMDRPANKDNLATRIARYLPTPRASRGGSATETMYGLGATREDDERSQGQVVGDITDWGPYAPAIERWEAVLGRPAPPPVRHDGKGGKPRLNPQLTQWMMGWPTGWVTDPEIGLTRAEQLKACGNGVVPQQAAAALREMLSRPGVPALTAAPRQADLA